MMADPIIDREDDFLRAIVAERNRAPVWIVERLFQMGSLQTHHFIAARRHIEDCEALEPRTGSAVIGERTSAQYDSEAPHRHQLRRRLEMDAVRDARAAMIAAAPEAQRLIDAALTSVKPSLAEAKLLPGCKFPHSTLVKHLRDALEALSKHHDSVRQSRSR